MGIGNPVHLAFVAIVALLVLGPKRLPDLARSLGNGMREFRESLNAAMHDDELSHTVVQPIPPPPSDAEAQPAPAAEPVPLPEPVAAAEPAAPAQHEPPQPAAAAQPPQA